MKRRNRFFYLVLGALLAFTLSDIAAPALAYAAKTISVKTGIRVFVDDQPLTMTDANGNTVQAFTYNGTTYLPARAISQTFGKNIQWDGKTQGVYIGKHESSTPAVMLQDLDVYAGEKIIGCKDMKTDNLGNEYFNPLTQYALGDGVRGSATYRIAGQYSRITGTFFLSYGERKSSENYTVMSIYGDGKLLYTATVRGGTDPYCQPVKFDVDLTGVQTLKFDFDCSTDEMGFTNTAYLYNVGLYS